MSSQAKGNVPVKNTAIKPRRGFSYWFGLYVSSTIIVFIFQMLAAVALFPLGVWSVGLFVLCASACATYWVAQRKEGLSRLRLGLVYALVLAISVITLWGGLVNLTIGGTTVAFIATAVALLRYGFMDK